jgi:predicted RNA-binding protein YlqC (UPF0109 family)
MDSGRPATNDDTGELEPENLAEFDESEPLDDSEELVEAEGSQPMDDLDEADALDEVEADRAGNTTATADIEELVQYIASKLVHNADDVTVESEMRGGTVYVSLRVPEEEMGRVIGREGRTAKAIRTLVSIAGSRHNVHARLDIDG